MGYLELSFHPCNAKPYIIPLHQSLGKRVREKAAYLALYSDQLVRFNKRKIETRPKRVPK